MKMKIEIQLYRFSELSKQAKENAIGSHSAKMYIESRFTEIYPTESDVIKSIESEKMLFSKNGKSEQKIKMILDKI